MTPIEIPTELMAAAPIVSSPIKIFTDSISTTLSITTLTKKSTEPIKDKYPNFIVYQPLTTRTIAGKSVFFTSSIENGKAMEWQKYIIELLKWCGITVLNPQRDDWNSSLPQNQLEGEILK